jgi:cytochrome b561
MALTNTSERYGSLSIALHWLMVLQLIGVYACINLADYFPEHSDPERALEATHFMLGLSVLAVVLLRIGARLAGTAPSPLPGTPRWQTRLAGATHLGLYALLLVNPLLGWMTLSARGAPIPFFGAELPALVERNRALARQLMSVHATIGTIGYYLIGLHVFAALVHHYWLHDRTVLRMLPSRRTSQGLDP